MSLFFRVLKGPHQGMEYPIESGHILGRMGGPAHIQLDDPKTSGHHAQIEGDKDSGFYLVDNNSKNGIRVNGKKVKRTALSPGLQVWVGNSLLEVAEKIPEAISEALTIAMPPTAVTTQQAVPKTPENDMRTWSQILEEFTSLIMDQADEKPKPLVPMAEMVQLSFLSGLQAETEWMVGYGPRRAGALSVDMPILEPNAPDICFEIIPTPQGVLFKTNHSDTVLINNKSQGSVLLKSGDMIRIHDTIIEVGFPS